MTDFKRIFLFFLKIFLIIIAFALFIAWNWIRIDERISQHVSQEWEKQKVIKQAEDLNMGRPSEGDLP